MGLLDWWRTRKAQTPAQPEPPAGFARADDSPAAHDSRPVHLERADGLLSRRSYAAALAAYQDAINAGEDPVAAHLGHARACIGLGRLEEALDSLEVGAALGPASVDMLSLLASVRLETGSPAEAVAQLRLALELAPERSDLHFLLGRALNRTGDCASAVAAYDEAIRLDPSDPGPRVNRGLIHLQELGQPERAEAEFRGALAVAPDHLGAMANLGLALHDLGRHDEAREVYRRGLERDPENVELRWNRGIDHLCFGRFAQGWRDYSLRFRRSGGRNLSAFDFPEWDGTPLPEGRLLVLAEQGLGDEIRFSSCIPDLRGLCDGVILECAPRLSSLFTRSFPWVDVQGKERHAPADWLRGYPNVRARIPIGELPRLLRPSIDRFPRHSGYLQADPARVASFRQRMAPDPHVRHVGLAWRGGTRKTRGAIRSLPLEAMEALFDVPNVRFVCLQHDVTEAERSLARAAGILFWDEAVAGIDSAAALIQALDAVVSVPNTNANLAGALGKRVWAMLNAAPDWYWRSVGGGSPWYPSATLVEAVTHNDWPGVVGQVRAELCDWARSAPAAGDPC